MTKGNLYFIAFITLATGALVYFLDRPLGQTYFMPASFGLGEDALVGLHDSLPSFLHALAFSLATIGAISPTEPLVIARVCVAWWLLESLLEIIQLDFLADKIAHLLPNIIDSVPVLEALPTYLSNGTFDVADLTAAAVGCSLAFFIGMEQRTLLFAEH